MLRPSRPAVLAAAVLAAAYGFYRWAKAMAEAHMADAHASLQWLAARHASLAHYDPPSSPSEARGYVQWSEAPRVDALVVHGSSFASVPSAAADLFADVLYPAGCRVVVLTGGVGRETPPLWAELADRQLTGLFGATEGWSRARPPTHVALPTQRLSSKPVLEGYDLQMSPEKLQTYCTEADVFLEIFVARCKERGVDVEYAGNPMANVTAAGGGGDADVARVYLETGSTHTGTNVEYARATLAAIGLATSRLAPSPSSSPSYEPLQNGAATGAPPVLAVVQQPQLQRRTCLTWQQQTGVAPIGWTVRPTEEATGRSVSEMLMYAIGELHRIPEYAASDKAFCAMPSDFPHALSERMGQLEPAIRAAAKLEAEAKAGSTA